MARSIRDQLARLRAPPARAMVPRVKGLGSEVEQVELPGELRDTAHGPVHVVDTLLEPRHEHGRVAIAGALDVWPAAVAALACDAAMGSVDLRRMLLLDTETTGLAGGAGTVPFLIGMAWFEDEALRVQQLFLRRLGEEGPMLRVLAERLARASCLVTFNGKSFDWPLLRNRYVLSRVPMPKMPPHLDLLHCARRIYKRRLPDVRLVSLEREVLGMVRAGDVDGSEIPSIYVDFLRGDESTRISTVIEHNRHDLVALAAVLRVLAERFERLRPEDDPRDHLGYAHVARRAGDTARARAFADAAAEGGGDGVTTVEAYMFAAHLARGRADVTAQRVKLEAALSASRPESLAAAEAHLALAKLLEHKAKDFSLAREHARHTAPWEGLDAQRHREARLDRRIACVAGTGCKRVRGGQTRLRDITAFSASNGLKR